MMIMITTKTIIIMIIIYIIIHIYKSVSLSAHRAICRNSKNIELLMIEHRLLMIEYWSTDKAYVQ